MNATVVKRSLRDATNRGVAVLGLLAMLLGQVALLSHDALIDHAGDEDCLVCHLGDRQDDSLTTAQLSYPLPGAAATPAPGPVQSPALNAKFESGARGPPRVL